MEDQGKQEMGEMQPQGQVVMPAMDGVMPGPATFQNASLYVGDLHPDVTEALLFEIFNAVGPVSSIRVCRDAVTRRSLGYAYVNFHQVADAERALDTMNYTLIKDRPCRMMWSQRDPSLRKNGSGNVFVKHLDLSIDNKALYDTFSLFGNILSCKVVTDGTGKSRGYGFVHFETTEAADEAIKKINGMSLAGKEVFVGKFLKKNERPGSKDWTNLYVKNIPKEWSRDKLDQVFSEVGPLSSCVVMTNDDGSSRGFGFVDYLEHEDAVAAIERFHGYEPAENIARLEALKKVRAEKGADKENANGNSADKSMDKKPDNEVDPEEEAAAEAEEAAGETRVKLSPAALNVCRAQKKTDRERELSKKFEELKIERQNKYQGVNLYVKNLDDRVDDDILRAEFEKFGDITSAKVMREKPTYGADGSKQPGISKGFGFVCFASPEEAIRAVTEMKNKLVMGKPLYVALAQRKEQRRAQLETQHRQQQRMINVSGLGPQPGMFPFNPPAMNNMNAIPPFSGPPAQFNRFNQQQMPAMQNMMGRQNGPMGQGPRGIPPQMPEMGRQGMPMNPALMRGQPMGPAGMGQMNFPMQQRMREDAPLSAEVLASVNPQQRKTMIGEKLYPMVHVLEPQQAAKVTGMLLEIDQHELLHLLESPEALRAKVQEAVDVLRRATANR